MSPKPNSIANAGAFDASDDMLEMLRAFEERPSLADDVSDNHGVDPIGDSDVDPDCAAMAQHLQLSSGRTRNAMWSEEWLYPVEAWSLILGLDVPFWESGWRECAEKERAGDWPHCSLLLNELERLRSLHILASSDDGKIRRNDAVRVAHALGYAIEPGTPAFDILVHAWGVRPARIRQRDVVRVHQPIMGGDACSWSLVQAAAAVLAFFPDIAATAWRDDAAQTILDTIETRQILPPSYFEEHPDRAELERIVSRVLELVVRAHDTDKAAHG